MGALLVVGLLAGTWWVLTDARGLGLGPGPFTFLLLCTAVVPTAVFVVRRATRYLAPLVDRPLNDTLVIDLRDDVVIDLRDHDQGRTNALMVAHRWPTDGPDGQIV